MEDLERLGRRQNRKPGKDSLDMFDSGTLESGLSLSMLSPGD